MGQPMRTEYVQVSDIDLFSSLVTLHFKLRPKDPITKIVRAGKRPQVSFHFLATAEHDVFGSLSVEQVLKIHAGDAEARSQADAMLVEVIDHMREKDRARQTAMDICMPVARGGRGLVPTMVVVNRDGWECILPDNPSADLIARMTRMIASVEAGE